MRASDDLTRRACGGDVAGGRVRIDPTLRAEAIDAVVVPALVRWDLLSVLEEVRAAVDHLIEDVRSSTERASLRLMLTPGSLRIDVEDQWALLPVSAVLAA